MKTITHRELRNNSAEVLRRVEAGETVQISNNGTPVAVLGPVHVSVIDTLTAGGAVRVAPEGVEALADLEPAASPVSSQEILDDVRGRW